MVSSFEATNSVFNITHENNLFSITIPSHWETKSAEKTIDELNKLLEFRSQNGIELHVKEVRKRRNKTKKGDNVYKLSDSDTLKKNEILQGLKKVKYSDLDDLVYRFQLSFNEIIDVLECISPTKRIGFSIPPEMYETNDIEFVSKHLFPKWIKVEFSIDNVRLKSNLQIIQTLKFTESIFLIQF